MSPLIALTRCHRESQDAPSSKLKHYRMQMSPDGLIAVGMGMLQNWLISRLPKMVYDLYLGFGVFSFLF
ncbi:hypothetical protein N836_13865 [Leptolyngbya sp. Heron Island J]|nr:hypothetical protein N836_13865 [Leptolyngbya sp. Heron Island J]